MTAVLQAVTTRPRVPTRAKVVFVAFACAVLWIVAATPARALTVPQAVNRYAPQIRLHPDETNLPASTAFFIKHSALKFENYQGCLASTEAAQGSVDPRRLGNRPPAQGNYQRYALAPLVGTQCNPSPDLYTTRDRTEDNDVGFYLDLDDSARAGKGVRSRIYFEYREHPRSITYWLFYAFNDSPGGDPANDLDHEGDWEKVSVSLDDNNAAQSVYYSAHDGGCVLSWSRAPKTGDGRPIAFSAIGSHANYPWPGRYKTAFPLVYDHAAAGGTPWQTWLNVKNIQRQKWYGYRGNWGGIESPSPTRLGADSGTFSSRTCERPS